MNRLLIVGLVSICLSCGSRDNQEQNKVEVEAEEVSQSYDPEARLEELGISLEPPEPPVANYVHAVRSGNMIYLAGKGPRDSEGTLVTGKLGDDMSVEAGYEAARLVGITQLAVLKGELGNLNNVVRIVKVFGMVNATDDFTSHPEVINGYSDLMVAVFGEKGRHARAAVGMASLPRNIPVEIEMIVEVSY